MSCDYYWSFYGHFLLFELHFTLSVTKQQWFCKYETPWMFPLLDILLEYWIIGILGWVIIGLLYVMFTFHTRIFYRGVPGFVTELIVLCAVWCRGLTTRLLYVGLLFGNLKNDNRFVSLIWRKTTFFIIISYLNASWYDNTLFSVTLFLYLK